MEKNSTANYVLRLPRSLKAEVERLAAADGISVNQFIAKFLQHNPLHCHICILEVL